MKIIKPINEHTFLIEKESKDGKEIEYSILSKHQIKPFVTLENNQVKYKANDYYLIIYSCDFLGISSLPIIEAAYDLQKDEVLDIVNNYKLQYALEDMFLYSQIFNKDIYLQAINDEFLGIVSEESINDFYNYLKGGNDNITNEEVKNYILSNNPNLIKYTNLSPSMPLIEFSKIYKNYCNEKINILNSMPQRLDFLNDNKVLSKKKNNRL